MEKEFKIYETDLSKTGGEFLLRNLHFGFDKAEEFLKELNKELDLDSCYISAYSYQSFILVPDNFIKVASKYGFNNFLTIISDEKEIKRYFERTKNFIKDYEIPTDIEKIEKRMKKYTMVLLNKDEPLNHILKYLINKSNIKDLIEIK